MITLSAWTHPTTGQVRVYIGNLPGARGAKVWAEECAADSFGSTIEIRARHDNMGRSELGNLINDAERAIDQLAGRRVRAFEDLAALAA